LNRSIAHVTGMGVASAAGGSCAHTLACLRSGKRNPTMPSLFSTSIPKPVFEVADDLLNGDPAGMRTLHLAVRAIDEALADARATDSLSDMRVGVCLGTTVASQLNDLEFYRRYRESGQAPMTAVDRYLSGNVAAAVASLYGCSGPTLTVVNACSSGADAIGMAQAWIRQGLCDAAIAGGADELSLIPLAGFNALGIMSDEPCAPFDRDRRGLNLGEGAGVLFLETADSAIRRGVTPALTCTGYGTFGDAFHLTAPRDDGSGLEAAIRHALSDANLTPDDIGFVNAHGTATPTNDAVEGATLARIFGKGCRVSATKGYTGHTLGAAGGVEAVLTLLSLREGWIPASAGFVHGDPAIPLEPVRTATTVQASYALSTSLAFGGNNSALIFGRCT
jgi:3-oxoacyl-[acyl-carrier-protein] synthase II